MSTLAVILVLTAVAYAMAAAWFLSDLDTGKSDRTGARTAPPPAVDPVGPGAAAIVVAPTATPDLAQDPGLAVYSKACAVCHATGVANAPKLGDKDAWEPSMAQGRDRLVQTVIVGKGAMPPRGACMDCSDQDLKIAIEYMLGQAGYEPARSTVARSAQTEDPLVLEDISEIQSSPTGEQMPATR